MPAVIGVLDAVIAVVRGVFFGGAALAAVACTLSWAARARHLDPFGRAARFARTQVDPRLAPIERRVVRAGGTSTSVPWWALVAVLLAGFALLAALNVLRDSLVGVYLAASRGPRGMVRLAVSWGFGLLQLALLVRVLTSWIGGAHTAIGRLARTMTEWMLGPVRRVLPPLGAVDLSPLVAWVLLSLVASVVLRGL